MVLESLMINPPGSLAGAEVFEKEQTASDFRGVVRMLREIVGEKSNHKKPWLQ